MPSRKSLIANMKLDPATKPIRATIKLQNNCLRARRVALGLSAREIAEKIGISYHTYLRLENMHRGPISVREGQPWLDGAVKLAKFYQVLPEHLFPSVVLAVDKPVSSREFDESEIQALLPDYMRRESLGPEEIMSHNQLRGTVTKALRMLKPIEVEVVKRHYGLDSGTGRNLTQVGREIKRSVTRTSQILNRAICKLGKQVPRDMTLPIPAPNKLGQGIRCIRHNLGHISELLDPDIPWVMNVTLSMPDSSSVKFEELQFQGNTSQDLAKAADDSALSTHLRLLKITIGNQHGSVMMFKGGRNADWTWPPLNIQRSNGQD